MKPEEDGGLARAITGALRSAIRDHGPITPEHIGSATKRVIGNLRNARLLPSEAAAALGRRGGQARKDAGVDFAKLGKRGGRAGKGSKKPRSPELQRLTLARRLIRGAALRKDGLVGPRTMAKLAPDGPEFAAPTTLQEVARALGVEREVQELTGSARE